FPFTFKLLINKENSNENAIKIFYTEKGLQFCEGIVEESPIIDTDNWIQLGQEVIQDLTKNIVLIEKWNESVNKKQILPTARNFILTIFNLDN
ncbi:MAG: hypothetical protein KGD61_05420, partial [Candidatus Lokiarchaeota archaeon]|nr:hypothetical protein [Candidatus Lokiarchaeota archaeon]